MTLRSSWLAACPQPLDLGSGVSMQACDLGSRFSSTTLALGQLVLIFTQLLSDLVVSSGGDAVSGSKGPSA